MENISGKVFNQLTAIKPTFQYKREWVWECLCVCGNTTNVRISKLKNETTKSCGCLKSKNLNHKQGTEHGAYKGYKTLSSSFYTRIKTSAKSRNIEFNVSIEYLHDLFFKQGGKCAYSGANIILPLTQRHLRGEDKEFVASLDRRDNTKGYVEGNLHWVSKRVNYMKHTMSEPYFLDLIEMIYKNKIYESKYRRH